MAAATLSSDSPVSENTASSMKSRMPFSILCLSFRLLLSSNERSSASRSKSRFSSSCGTKWIEMTCPIGTLLWKHILFSDLTSENKSLRQNDRSDFTTTLSIERRNALQRSMKIASFLWLSTSYVNLSPGHLEQMSKRINALWSSSTSSISAEEFESGSRTGNDSYKFHMEFFISSLSCSDSGRRPNADDICRMTVTTSSIKAFVSLISRSRAQNDVLLLWAIVDDIVRALFASAVESSGSVVEISMHFWTSLKQNASRSLSMLDPRSWSAVSKSSGCM